MIVGSNPTTPAKLKKYKEVPMYEFIQAFYNLMIEIHIPVVLFLILVYFIYAFTAMIKTYIKDDYPYLFPKILNHYIDWGEAKDPKELFAAAVTCFFSFILISIIGILVCSIWPLLWVYSFLLWLRYKNRKQRIIIEKQGEE